PDRLSPRTNHLEESIRPYIDLIDTLRSAGIHKDLALPTIIVIGDQSSGKSSVLEALSGVPLPRGSGIVTRCPLELRLKKVNVGVNWKAVLSYSNNKIEFVDSSLLENHVHAAQNELAGKGVGIRDDLITLEIMSPDVCDLTLIDLPGIARVPVNGQPQDIGNQIKRLIRKYIEKQETINMVVCPCNTDIATTEALKIAQEVDPDGKRTIAILTKPDLIDRGTETRILDIVHNKVIPLRKGYIMVKCRGQQQIDDNISLEEAAQMESDFFRTHEHFSVVDQILCVCVCCQKSLPQLNEQIKKKLWDLKNELKECEAGPPQDPKGAKQFLIKTLTRFNEEIKSLSLGEQITEDHLFVQLREKFRKILSSNEKLSQKYRGRELLGFSNYRTFENVLQRHVATHKAHAIKLLNIIKGIVTHLHVHVRVLSIKPKECLSFDVCIFFFLKTSSYSNSLMISEQFEMEGMIYTQDPIYLKFLNEISDEKYSEDQLPVLDKKSKYSEMLQAYSEVGYVFLVSNNNIMFCSGIICSRMSDQLPMMISFFMLKETAQLLSTDMLSLLDGVNVSELLFENSDVGRRRKDLQTSLDRLTAAQEALSDFI
uniref:Interferon-induced GTP-binding protein Mx2-like n=1 Tax=Sinocyclocheilus anshuiensis TaxID=1608454 RepID=A0A671T2P1_9TELE